MATNAYVGLGGNVGPVAARIAAAVARIGAWSFVTATRCSPLYATAPLGPVREQPRFVNAVAEVAVVGVTAADLLAQLTRLETQLGRTRDVPQGPRVIDLDLVLFGAARIDQPGLTVPHPRAAERAFVLRPLADLVGADYAGLGRPLRDLLADPAVTAQDIRPWAG